MVKAAGNRPVEWRRGKRQEVAQPTPWERGYYYRARKVNGRVRREYVGRGPVVGDLLLERVLDVREGLHARGRNRNDMDDDRPELAFDYVADAALGQRKRVREGEARIRMAELVRDAVAFAAPRTVRRERARLRAATQQEV